jgi:hypothetical protein
LSSLSASSSIYAPRIAASHPDMQPRPVPDRVPGQSVIWLLPCQWDERPSCGPCHGRGSLQRASSVKCPEVISKHHGPSANHAVQPAVDLYSIQRQLKIAGRDVWMAKYPAEPSLPRHMRDLLSYSVAIWGERLRSIQTAMYYGID